MKILAPLACIVVALLLLPAAGAPPQPSADEGTQVLVLGTFHFANPGLDMVDTQVDDVLSAERQSEIEEVVEALAQFRPTRILLELPPNQEDDYNAMYAAWRRGERELSRNEHDQLGMRLAQRFDLERLHGIDAKQDVDVASVFAKGMQSGQQELVTALQQRIGGIQAALAEIHAPGRTMGEMLRSHNSAHEALDEGLYMLMAGVGEPADPVGADVVSAWYRRNLMIFGNLLRAAGANAEGEQEAERVLVIYGSGHLAQLSAFIDTHPDLTRVSALDYLP